MGRRGPPKRYTEVIYVNVDRELAAAVVELAAACEMPVSELCRRILTAQVAEAYAPADGA